jgi:hypothetical protein
MSYGTNIGGTPGIRNDKTFRYQILQKLYYLKNELHRHGYSLSPGLYTMPPSRPGCLLSYSFKINGMNLGANL